MTALLSFPCRSCFPEGICFALTVTLSPGRCAWQRLNTTWRGPLPSRPARTRCAASAWRWCMRNPRPQRGGSGSCPTARTPTACPASASGGVPSSSRTPSSSELWGWGAARSCGCHRAQQSLLQAARAACRITAAPLGGGFSPLWLCGQWAEWTLQQLGPCKARPLALTCVKKQQLLFFPMYVLNCGIFPQITACPR